MSPQGLNCFYTYRCGKIQGVDENPHTEHAKFRGDDQATPPHTSLHLMDWRQSLIPFPFGLLTAVNGLSTNVWLTLLPTLGLAHLNLRYIPTVSSDVDFIFESPALFPSHKLVISLFAEPYSFNSLIREA